MWQHEMSEIEGLSYFTAERALRVSFIDVSPLEESLIPSQNNANGDSKKGKRKTRWKLSLPATNCRSFFSSLR